MFVVYQIRNIGNNYVYIGSTNNTKKRFKRHLNELRKNTHHSIYLQRAFNLYGEDKFLFEILFEFNNKKDMHDKEKSLIQDLTGKYNVSKIVSGGDLISYHPNLDIIRKKHSDNYQKIKQENNGVHPFELIDKTGKNNSNYRHGNNCGERFCIDCNKKISLNTKHNKCGSCVCKLKTGERNSFYGKSHSKESIAKMIKNRDSQKLPSNTLKVIIDGVLYESAAKAAKINGLNLPSVLNRCRNPKFPNYEFYQEKEVGKK